jgi:hypothetical protein
MEPKTPDKTRAGSLKSKVAEAISSARKATKRVLKEVAQLDLFARFKSPDVAEEIDFPIDLGRSTVWATESQMAALFGVAPAVIVQHMKNVIEDKELDEDESASTKFTRVQTVAGKEVSREIEHYSVDMILAIGYRVSGKKAAEFRRWATRVLRGYIEDGYALNGARLKSDPDALANLAQKVREIRTSEQQLYTRVRETFKSCSIDYDPQSDEARSFFAQSQDRFHYAVSERTAAQIIIQRANGALPNMGMKSLGNKAPTLADAKIAKNYMDETELRSMEILGEQWLLYAEGMAMRRNKVSMSRLLNKLSELVVLNEYSTFPGYAGVRGTRVHADEHARKQLEIYRKGLPSFAA